MFDKLPKSAFDVFEWGYEQYQPYFDDLLSREVTPETVEGWLADWSKLTRLAYEAYARMQVATTVDTTDSAAEARLINFLENIYPPMMIAGNALNQKLVASGVQPPGFEIPLRNIRAELALFREENLPLQTELGKLSLEYDKIIGAQTVEWEGKEVTLTQLNPVLQDHDRGRRKQAWMLAMERRLQDREALNDLWARFMGVRGRMAENAGLPDFRAYQWQALNRFDYTPEDSVTFQNAIEEVVVPAARRIYERRREQLGVDRLRPWDIDVDVAGRPPLRPYQTTQELESRLENVFNRVDPALGAYFQTMRAENLLDLENRKGKAPGGYCTSFPVVKRPFIFMNAVGIHDDVQTLLHEGGHAFHVFESAHLPYRQQEDVPMEFAEVASMAMELLGGPYLAASEGGYYSQADAARARIEHLEGIIQFWPYMAVVDAFQHWVYTNHSAATQAANCDAKWAELWDRFMVGIDYSGLDDIKATGWHRKLHIFQLPFYYIEYGLAQLGSVQVWANSLKDQSGAVASYRKALALGGTAALPDLFATAGAKFAFDADTLRMAVDLIESTLDELATAV